jgi:hypothetical protein
MQGKGLENASDEAEEAEEARGITLVLGQD